MATIEEQWSSSGARGAGVSLDEYRQKSSGGTATAQPSAGSNYANTGTTGSGSSPLSSISSPSYSVNDNTVKYITDQLKNFSTNATNRFYNAGWANLMDYAKEIAQLEESGQLSNHFRYYRPNEVLRQAQSLRQTLATNPNATPAMPSSYYPQQTQSYQTQVGGVSTTTPSSAPLTPYRWNEGADYQARLQHFAQNQVDAQREILAVKQMYEQEKAAGVTPDRLQQISSWADQVRQAAGISNNDQTYGNAQDGYMSNVPGYGGGTQTLTPSSTINPDGSLKTTIDNKPAENVDVYQGTSYTSAQKLANMLGVSYTRDPSTGKITISGKQFDPMGFDAQGNPILGVRNVAEALGYQVDWDDKNGTVKIIKSPSSTSPGGPGSSYSGTPGSGTGAPGTGYPGGTTQPTQPTTPSPFQEPDLSDWSDKMMDYQQFTPDWNSYYQQSKSMLDPQYQQQAQNLQSTLTNQIQAMNESMNKRGIFTSGIAQAAENDLRAKTTDAVAKVFISEQGAIEKMAQQLYQSAFKQVQDGNDFALKQNEFMVKQMMDERKMAFDQWLKTQNLTLDQQKYALDAWTKMSTYIMNNQKQAFDEFKFGNLSAQQMSTLQQQYDKMGQDWQKAMLPYQDMTQYQKAQMDYKQQALEISTMLKQMGIDVDLQKLEETIRHNQATEGISFARLEETIRSNQTDEATARERMAMEQQRIDNAAKNDAQRIQIAWQNASTSANRSVVDAIGKQLTSINTQIKGIYDNAMVEPDKNKRTQMLQQLSTLSGQRDQYLGQLSQYSSGGFYSPEEDSGGEE